MDYKNLAIAAISEELKKFDLMFNSMKCDNPRLQEMIEYMYKADG